MSLKTPSSFYDGCFDMRSDQVLKEMMRTGERIEDRASTIYTDGQEAFGDGWMNAVDHLHMFLHFPTRKNIS